MNGTVTKFCDPDSIRIPGELLEVHVEEAALDAEIQRLGLRYAREIPAERVESGDMAECLGDPEAYPDGRKILLYTATALPGAEAAAQAVMGKSVGDRVETEILGKAVTLTVKKILRREPVEVNDDLIRSLGLEEVGTLSEYRDFLRKKAEADQKLENSKAIIRCLMDEMLNCSEFRYDGNEMEAYIRKMKAEYAAQGPEDGIPPMSDEELRQSVILQTEQGWLMEAFCRERGIAIDEAAAEDEANQMAEMSALMGEPAPDREELLSMARQNQCFTAFFDYADKVIAEKMGGSYGDR